ncbi:putative ER transporter, 6TM [Microdochium nivale]|nr:putative ER transporter, 6TM [Microdochium nivale]
MADTASQPASARLSGPAGDSQETAATAHDHGANGSTDETLPSPPTPAAPASPKPGFLARLGISPFIIGMCLKGAVGPTTALAILQVDAVAQYFSTIGYVVAIISVLALPIMPRGKFLQATLLNLLGVSIGAAVGVLALWSAFQARLHTETRPSGYNSSQSAVAGIWLFVNIWFSNLMRARNPSLNIPVIVYTIMVNISATYSPLMTSVPALEAFIKQLYVAFLAAFALACGVSLLILPMSSRTVASGQLKGLLMLLRGIVKQEKVYLESLEKEDMFSVPVSLSASTGLEDAASKKKQNKKGIFGWGGKNKQQTKKKNAAPHNSHAEAEAVKQTIFRIRELMGNIQVDLPFAQREMAWGKLEPRHFKHVTAILREVVIATTGIGTIIDIFQRIAEKRGWVTDGDTDLALLAAKLDEKRVWNGVMKQLHEPFRILAEAIDQGLEHAGVALELLPMPKDAAAKKDMEKRKKKGKTGAADVDVEEAKGNLVNPGDSGFANVLRSKVMTFRTVRKEILQAWARENGLAHNNVEDIDVFSANEEKHKHERQQLFLLLYIETLMQAAGDAVLKLVEYADNRIEDGSMAKNRLIVPTAKRMKQWITGVLENKDRSQDQNADLFDPGLAVVYTGTGFSKRDPEHRPATTAWQKFGNMLRAFSKILSSEESGFGLRVACATMTIGIVAFLESSHVFFQQQRLVWAMIMVALAMTQTSGQSIHGFLCRVGGTVIAMVLSIVNFYIVNGHTPGVFVFLFLFLAIEFLFFFKYPALIQASIICIVTHVMIIGYELQTQKLGLAVSERTGQPWYPIYELAPYRLATVAGGCFVAFLWTIFPAPMTDRTWLRRDLAATLFLLGSYFGVIKTKLQVTLDCGGADGVAGSSAVKGTPAHALSKQQRQISGKLMLLLPSLRQHAEFQRWEPTIGGEFPRQTYEDIILRAMRINSYITLIEHTIDKHPPVQRLDTAKDKVTSSSEEESSSSTAAASSGTSWVRALRRLLSSSNPTQDTIICTLVLLSNALDSGHALPPNLPLPKPYALTRMLEDMRDESGNRRGLELLDASHMADAGYAEFAVLQVCSTLICDDLAGLARDVADLVGTVDFGFEVNGGGGGIFGGLDGGQGNNGVSSSSSSTSDGDGSSTMAGTSSGGVEAAGSVPGKKGKND